MGLFSHQNELNMSQKTACLKMVKQETLCKNECEPARIAIYNVYYTKSPEQKWRR
jgi:hypothetical protein